MKKIIFIYFILLNYLFSQSGSIVGKVFDNKSGKGLIGANVIIDGTNQGAASDASGRYIITNVPFGDYKLKVSYIGYQTLELQVTVLSDQQLEANLSLEPEAIQMETYVVTASRKENV